MNVSEIECRNRVIISVIVKHIMLKKYLTQLRDSVLMQMMFSSSRNHLQIFFQKLADRLVNEVVFMFMPSQAPAGGLLVEA